MMFCNDVPETEAEDSFLEQYSSSVLFFNIRFSFYVSKISSLLNAIHYQLIEPVNFKLIDDDVLERERKMADEFERRFSRINLYSIQLKMKKLEKEIMVFKSKHTCKIAQTFILRALVLSIFKYLTNSLQAYSKFIRKLKIPICRKLKDLLNYVTHTHHTVSHIVDHSVLEIHDLNKLSGLVMNVIHNRTITSTKTDKITGRKKKCDYNEKKTEPNVMAPQTVANSIIKDSPKKKNVRFEICQHKIDSEIMTTNSENPSISQKKEPFRKRLCATTTRLCDIVLDDLMNEMVEDIMESIRSSAMETFEREFAVKSRK